MRRPSLSHPPTRPRVPRHRPRRPRPSTPNEPQQTPWQRRAQWLRTHPVVVILETAGLVGLIFAVGFFFYELRERQDERTARAWQLVTTPASGNSGKVEALEYLNSQYGCLPGFVPAPDGYRCWKTRTSLTGVDFSRPKGKAPTYLRVVNLPGANLSGANLSGADLFRANLFAAFLLDANLVGAELTDANLFGSILLHANLSYANLSDAKMSFVNMSGANLTGADLSGANLTGAYLSGADLTDANLTGADLSGANLSGINLTKVDLSQAWAYRYNPPSGSADLPPGSVPSREIGETWPEFVDRIIRERPDLGWTEDMKDNAPREN